MRAKKKRKRVKRGLSSRRRAVQDHGKGPGRRPSLMTRARHFEQQQNFTKASLCYQELLTDNPEEREALIGLALAQTEMGNYGKAAELVARGLEKFSDDPDLLSCAGLVQWRAGAPEIALECFQSALRVDPSHYNSLVNISDLLFKQHQWADAETYLKRLVQIDPENASVFFALGTAYLHLNKPVLARQYLTECLRILPQQDAVSINYAVSLRMMKQYEKSEKILLSVLAKKPENVDALNAASSLYTDWRKFDKALLYSEKALTLDPENIETLNSCAYLWTKTGKLERGKECYLRVLEMDPGNRLARFGLGGILLKEENFKDGLPLYESRFEVMQSWLDGPWPVWDGRKVQGTRILVRAEQGVGDTIQFCRFLSLLRKAGVRVLFSCQPSLGRLLRGIEGIDELFAVQQLPVAKIQADAQVALLSLMGVFGITLETIPADCPYIKVDQELILEKSSILPRGNKMKVGLVWAGNPDQTDDHNRSLHIRQLLPLADFQQDIEFFSLQVGYAEKQLEEIRGELDIFNLAPYIGDFADTAAFMENMDLVVSVCTSTIHLAGALNRPAVVLLPYAADWRWFLERNDSPWYPSVHLIRQPEPGDWQTVIRKLMKYLKGLIEKQGESI